MNLSKLIFMNNPLSSQIIVGFLEIGRGIDLMRKTNPDLRRGLQTTMDPSLLRSTVRVVVFLKV